MIEAIQIQKHYGSETILKDVTVRIAKGDKVGVVGKNGAGKTTLVRILTGEDTDFSGTLKRTENETVGYVAQHFPASDISALEYMVEHFTQTRERLRGLEERMTRTDGKELARVLEEYGELRSAYDSLSGDEAEDRALTYLETLKLDACADTPLSSLSGGERNILAMGRALLARPDVLILDEPGNHLDIWGLAWLEQFIREYQGAVIVISHNRYLLDRVCSRIVDIERGKATSFTGNYSAWRIDKLRNTVAGEMAYRADEKKIARLEALVKRFEEIARRTADPAWGRRLHSRRTHLEKTKENAREKPANPVASFSVSFETEASKADIALKTAGLSCAFGDRVLFSGVSLTIRTGERIALVGANGSGKSTFIREVLRLHEAQDPSVFIGPSMNIAWCSQHGEGLVAGKTVFDECVRAGSKTFEEAWKILSRFLFTRDSLAQKTETLSGGERNKLQLALAVIRKANFLILDEPTNHLDIASCEAIEDALQDFAGTILAVSHDRYFLDRIATGVLEIAEGKITSWEGNFSEFWFARYGKAPESPIRTVGQKTLDSSIEKRIVALESEKKELETAMGKAYTEGNLDKARALGAKLARAGREIERLYAQWG